MNKEFRKEDEQYMRKAITCAQQAFSKGEVPIGAVLVADGGANRTNGTAKVLALTYNLVETLCDATAHAEMQAITAAANYLGGKYLIDCTLYVTIEPCQMCAGALYWSQISKVVFGAGDNKRGFSSMGAKLHPKTEVVQGVLESECAELMQRFFAQKR